MESGSRSPGRGDIVEYGYRTAWLEELLDRIDDSFDKCRKARQALTDAMLAPGTDWDGENSRKLAEKYNEVLKDLTACEASLEAEVRVFREIVLDPPEFDDEFVAAFFASASDTTDPFAAE